MTASAPVHVSALLLCRKVTVSVAGDLSLEDVVEVLPVAALPGDVGPLTFVAFVRHLPPGPGRGAFLVRWTGAEPRELARCPVELTIPKGYEGRQVALQVRLPSLTLGRGGWYEVAFEWEGRTLAVNRFAVGVRSSPS